MVAVLSWPVSDSASCSFWTESVQKVSPVIICIGISHGVRHLPCLVCGLGASGHPILGVTAQLADRFCLLRCPPHATRI